METSKSMLCELDNLLIRMVMGLSNLNVMQTACAEGTVSSTECGDALCCTWYYLHDIYEEMRDLVDAAFRKAVGNHE